MKNFPQKVPDSQGRFFQLFRKPHSSHQLNLLPSVQFLHHFRVEVRSFIRLLLDYWKQFGFPLHLLLNRAGRLPQRNKRGFLNLVLLRTTQVETLRLACSNRFEVELKGFNYHQKLRDSFWALTYFGQQKELGYELDLAESLNHFVGVGRCS